MTTTTDSVSTIDHRLLIGKYAVVFGAGGSIGSAVAREFAKEGAFLASDRARLFTGTVVNSTAGAALD